MTTKDKIKGTSKVLESLFETEKRLSLARESIFTSEPMVNSCCGSYEQHIDGEPLYDELTGTCANCKGLTTYIPESDYYE